jgi:hypothetical protein
MDVLASSVTFMGALAEMLYPSLRDNKLSTTPQQLLNKHARGVTNTIQATNAPRRGKDGVRR